MLLDTSFVVEALVRAQTRHESCRAYLERLLDNGTTLYFNRLLEFELAETAFRLALEEGSVVATADVFDATVALGDAPAG